MPSNIGSFGKFLIFIGIALIIMGVLLLLASKIPYIGKLPGDIYIKKKNFIVYIPIMTSVILSIILSLILTIIFRR